ncbi:UDP-2,4-diacetamido-2,4,6-trideoxy-beta-L-altropyranose hydrolase [Paenibacillus sp. MER TA 81-3]|uniref:UDP-2,4-diacetamido-2,4, 6-trideoxy-beta-L-altropyranose hydrolase n=1 Tax=Paenibacillus sp. MER TA 81-3 TaxID=2939573 RepID=UPI002041DF4B|nr:UDP-2,4-diacetamido-2,4,6-trideoxy-beta-L-altropyranose hydrolase [Paenibacillus sp. MER TA 81-3]MCM3338752.1 UDP-2,4-diacetamido-2,4,6-trideoxy-beta-L-altropyranose hydrolase [Paenibacillus sp. MER TA 81-3]
MFQVVIRVDASEEIGLGHIMRCITLAQMLQGHFDANIIFVCNSSIPTFVVNQIKKNNYTVIFMDGDLNTSRKNNKIDARIFIEAIRKYGEIDLVIVDHYQLDIEWEKEIRAHTKCILVIDDLANRHHDCDVLLDQNLTNNMSKKYENLLPRHSLQLLGPMYTLLRKEFFNLSEMIDKKKRCRNVFINFGGSDPTNETIKFLRTLKLHIEEFREVSFSVVAGPSNSCQLEIKELCNHFPNVIYYPESKEIPEMLLNSDLAIGAGGVSLWERSFMGVPSIVIAVADNQIEAIKEAERLGMVWYIGVSNEECSKKVLTNLRYILRNPTRLKEKSSNSLSVMEPLRGTKIHPLLLTLETIMT